LREWRLRGERDGVSGLGAGRASWMVISRCGTPLLPCVITWVVNWPTNP